MSSPSDPETPPEPPSLRALRHLVTVLTAVMILGIVVITTLTVLRYTQSRAPLPETLTLPSGAIATAFTQGPTWYAVVTKNNEILVFDRATQQLRQTFTIETAP